MTSAATEALDLVCVSVMSTFNNLSFVSMQKRQVLVTITEISLPLLFTTILIILRQRVNSVQYTNATIYQPFKINDIPYFPQHPFAKWYLVYIPSNVTAVETIANSVRDSLSRVVGGKFYTNGWWSLLWCGSSLVTLML